MLANVDDVIRWLELQNLEWWTVSLTKDDNAKVFDSLDDETLEARKQRFRETMRLATGNRFVVRGKRNKSDGRGMFYEEFSNNNTLAPANNSIGNTVTGLTPEEVEKRIKEALDNANRERELQELKKQNSDLMKAVKEYDTAGTRFMQKLEPYIGMLASTLVGKLVPNQPAISVASISPVPDSYDPDDDENEVDPDDQPEIEINNDEMKIQTALIKWIQADPDYLTLLEAISDMAERKDPMYEMAKNFIKK